MRRGLFYLPFALPLLLLLSIFLLPLIVAVLVLNLGVLIGGVLGFSPLATILLFIAILAGSMVNIPLAEYECEVQPLTRRVRAFGFEYVVPEWRNKTVVAVNLGGAVIPIIIALYLAIQAPLIPFLLAAGFVILISKIVARPVRGVGIAMPLFIAPLAAILGAMVSLDYLGYTLQPLAKIAFSAGVFGVLIGADLLNLRRLREMCMPMISIGGAGTFDGIFLTGVFAVLFAGFII